MGILSLKEIVEANEFETIEVEVPEWGGSVLLRPLSVVSREKIENAIKAESSNNSIMILTLSESIVDEDEKPLFTKASLQDLRKKKGQVISRLYNECLKLNKAEDAEGNG